MTRGQLILCEQAEKWLAGMRRQCERHRPPAQWVRVGQVRSLDDARSMLDRWPESLLAIEVTTDRFARILEAVPPLTRCFPRMIWIALDASALGAASRGLREAGALHVAASPRDLAPVIDLAVRHLRPPPLPHSWMTDPIREQLDRTRPAGRTGRPGRDGLS